MCLRWLYFMSILLLILLLLLWHRCYKLLWLTDFCYCFFFFVFFLHCSRCWAKVKLWSNNLFTMNLPGTHRKPSEPWTMWLNDSVLGVENGTQTWNHLVSSTRSDMMRTFSLLQQTLWKTLNSVSKRNGASSNKLVLLFRPDFFRRPSICATSMKYLQVSVLKWRLIPGVDWSSRTRTSSSNTITESKSKPRSRYGALWKLTQCLLSFHLMIVEMILVHSHPEPDYCKLALKALFQPHVEPVGLGAVQSWAAGEMRPWAPHRPWKSNHANWHTASLLLSVSGFCVLDRWDRCCIPALLFAEGNDLQMQGAQNSDFKVYFVVCESHLVRY